MRRRSFVVGLAATGLLPAVPSFAQNDPLQSWNDGPVKRAILDFVARVTTPSGADFVPPTERIATFDNDGTLWIEQPNYVQAIFAEDRVRALANRHPEWQTQEPFKWVLDNDRDAIANMSESGFATIVVATHSGLTTEEFREEASKWIATARHPRFNRPYTDLVYQPMLELLALLRTHRFKTFIVSGGGVEFMRPWTERTYGIPPEQVVGSSGLTKYVMQAPDKPVLMKEAKIELRR
jgi:phosphoglycolate phosphatase-like HAD superfamily hydrolase